MEHFVPEGVGPHRLPDELWLASHFEDDRDVDADENDDERKQDEDDNEEVVFPYRGEQNADEAAEDRGREPVGGDEGEHPSLGDEGLRFERIHDDDKPFARYEENGEEGT